MYKYVYKHVYNFPTKNIEIFSIFFGQKLETEYYTYVSDNCVFFYTHFWISFLDSYLPPAARAALRVQSPQEDFYPAQKLPTDCLNAG